MKRFRLCCQAVTLGEFVGIIGIYALYAALRRLGALGDFYTRSTFTLF